MGEQPRDSILIVEDDPAQALLLENMLVRNGYQVFITYGGKEALASVNSSAPSLIISDILMPDMNGYQLCSAIRASEDHRTLPVMLLTALTSVEDVVMALEAGADYFITKPYKEQYLISKIKSILADNARLASAELVDTKIRYQGSDYRVTSHLPRILDLLISTYELSMIKNQEQLDSFMQRMKAEDALRESEERFRNILEYAPIGMAVLSLDGRFLLVNRALSELVGYGKQELEGLTFQEITHPDDLDADLSTRQELLEGSAVSSRKEKRYLRKDGQEVWVQLTASLLRDRMGRPLHFIAQVEDITERKLHQEQIHRLAYYDALTNLPNRRLLKDRLHQALVQAGRFGRALALMFLDLDNFKLINDVLGHDVGDEILKIVAERLTGCVRGMDTVCRQGGDEFIIVLTEIASPCDAELVAEKIIKALVEPIFIEDNELCITTSIGIAIYPVNGADDARALMKKADMAMYMAKNLGKNCYSICQGG